MRRSDSITSLAKALVLAKKKMEAPKKNKTAKITDTRSYSYADLSGVKDAYQEALGANGLGVLHSIAPVDGHLMLTTTLLHESGEWVASDYPIQTYQKPQEQGSALTYFKRYNVCALLDIVAEDDDDGAAAQQATPAKVGTSAPKPTSAVPPSVAPSVLSREEIEAMHSLAKTKGLTTVTEFRAFLKGLTSIEQAKDLSKAEYVSVMDALKAMREKVPA